MQRVRVGDVLKLQRRQVSIDPTSEYKLIGVYSFGKGIFHRDPLRGADLGAYKYFEIHPGDLVLSNIQAWERAIAYATPVDQGTIGTHRFLSYIPIDGKIDTNWAHYFFLSKPGFALIEKAAPGSVTRNRTLAIARFENLEIPLPAMTDQRRVASKLDGLVSMSRKLRRLRQMAITKASALPAALAHRYDISDKQKRARGWLRIQGRDVLEEVRDEHYVDPTKTYPNIGILSFGRGLFEKPPIEGANTSAKKLYRIASGQFVYSRLFAFEGAYAAVPSRFHEYFVSNEFPAFNVDRSRVLVEYLNAHFRSPATWLELAAESKGLGVRRQRIHPATILKYQLWVPPIEEQKRIVKQLKRIAIFLNMRSASTPKAEVLETALINGAFSEFESS